MDINQSSLSKYRSAGANTTPAKSDGNSDISSVRSKDTRMSSGSHDSARLDWKEGQILKGTIVDRKSNEVSLAIEPGRQIVTAKLSNDIPLSIGQSATFKVTDNVNGQYTLKYMPNEAETTSNPTILKALTASNLSITDRNKSIVAELLNNNMPIDKQTLQTVVRLSHINKDASPRTLVLMMKNNIPMTASNIMQFEAFQNGTSRLLDDIQNITNELSGILTEAGNDNTDQAIILNGKMLDILYSSSDSDIVQALNNPDTAISKFLSKTDLNTLLNTLKQQMSEGSTLSLSQQAELLKQLQAGSLSLSDTIKLITELFPQASKLMNGTGEAIGLDIGSRLLGIQQDALINDANGSQTVGNQNAGNLSSVNQTVGNQNMGIPSIVGQISGNQFAGNIMTDEQMIEGKFNGDRLNGTQLSGEQITGGQINGGQINGGQINGGQFTGDKLNGLDLQQSSSNMAEQASANNHQGIVPQNVAPIITSLFEQLSTLQSGGNDIGHILNPAERNAFIEQLSTLPGVEDFTGKFTDGTATIKDVLGFVQNSLTNANAADVSALLQSPIYHVLLNEAFHQKWTVSPEKLADKNAMVKFYDDLQKDMAKLSDALDSNKNMGDHNHSQSSAKNIQDNLNFLKNLNEVFTFQQLPLKFKNQDVHSDLYVYTKKNALKDKNDVLSVLLHLTMNHLGPINIHIKMDHNTIQANFYLDDNDAGKIISENLPFLSSALQKKGYSLHADVRSDYKEPDFCKDFIEQDTTENNVKRYSFDIRT